MKDKLCFYYIKKALTVIKTFVSKTMVKLCKHLLFDGWRDLFKEYLPRF